MEERSDEVVGGFRQKCAERRVDVHLPIANGVVLLLIAEFSFISANSRLDLGEFL